MGHTFTNLLYHVTFSTYERQPLIHTRFMSRLHAYMGGIARKEFGSALAIGGVADHVHGLLVISPAIALSDALCKWKSLSSKWVHDSFRGKSGFAWQEGYAAFTVSRSNVPRVTAYIAGQDNHHKKMTFDEELERLLEKHGIRLDERGCAIG